MITTVTGIFAAPSQAFAAFSHLMRAGFADERVRVVDAMTLDRHQFIHQRTSDTGRAVLLGAAFGTLVGLIAGVLLTEVLAPLPSVLLGCFVGSGGGAILGFLVGRLTTTQVEDELEHQVDAGSVIVSVTTDGARGPEVLQLFAKDGAVNMVSTAVSFHAGVLPIAQSGMPQEALPRESLRESLPPTG